MDLTITFEKAQCLICFFGNAINMFGPLEVLHSSYPYVFSHDNSM